MSDNNIENWENELKDKFTNHQEPTDAKDFDAFMDKLETNDFFEEKGVSRFPVKWIVLLGILITGIILWMMNEGNNDKQIPSIHKNIKVIETEKNQNSPTPENKEIHSDNKNNVQEIETPKEPLIIQEDNKEIKKSIEPIQLDKSILVELEEDVKGDSVNRKQSMPKDIIDSTAIQKNKEELKEVPKKVKTPKKRIVIMATDTIVVTDTSHVKHRKKNIRRK